MTSVVEWVRTRVPPVPEEVSRWMEPVADRAAGPSALADEAEAALLRALDPRDRPRDGAFDLLAADGFLTWAAEAAMDEADPDRELQALVRRFAG